MRVRVDLIWGIDALEISAINANNDFFNRHPYLDVPTHNETIYDKVNHTFAKRINFVAEQCERVSEATTLVLKQKHFPLVLSGDHSSALGTIAGIKQTYPNKSLGVVLDRCTRRSTHTTELAFWKCSRNATSRSISFR